MEVRYSNAEIEQHIANCDGAGFPTNSTIKVMRQLVADIDKLAGALEFYSNVNFYSPKNYVKVLLNDQGAKARYVLKELGDDR